MIHAFVEWKTLELITLQNPLRTHTHYNDSVTLQIRVLLRKISLFGSEETPCFLKDLDDSLPFSQKPNLGLHP
jgi:hypothetical protein